MFGSDPWSLCLEVTQNRCVWKWPWYHSKSTFQATNIQKRGFDVFFSTSNPPTTCEVVVSWLQFIYGLDGLVSDIESQGHWDWHHARCTLTHNNITLTRKKEGEQNISVFKREFGWNWFDAICEKTEFVKFSELVYFELCLSRPTDIRFEDILRDIGKKIHVILLYLQ